MQRYSLILKIGCAVLLIAAIIFVTANFKNGEIVLTSDPNERTLVQEIKEDYLNAFDEKSKSIVDADFIDWLGAKYDENRLVMLRDKLIDGSFSYGDWHEIMGNSLNVLKSYYLGETDPQSPNYNANIKRISSDGINTVIRVVGDVSLAENWAISEAYDERKAGLNSILSSNVVNYFNAADIMLVNNEFAYSTRGTPLNKAYTFRADPSRVNILKELGVDIVSLANNHAYDYGPDAFADTLATLDSAGISYIGAGKNIDEAKKPTYFIVNGYKFAFTAATRAEKNIVTPAATENSSGVLRTYDPTEYLGVISEAAEKSDYCIAYVHWGAEGSHDIEAGLPEMGAKFIDAGADIVIGAHAHVLQGIEFYKGKPIVYNLGNFIFNGKTMETGILEITANRNLEMTYRFIPCLQNNCYTKTLSGDDAIEVLKMMKHYSKNVSFYESFKFLEK